MTESTQAALSGKSRNSWYEILCFSPLNDEGIAIAIAAFISSQAGIFSSNWSISVASCLWSITLVIMDGTYTICQTWYWILQGTADEWDGLHSLRAYDPVKGLDLDK